MLVTASLIMYYVENKIVSVLVQTTPHYVIGQFQIEFFWPKQKSVGSGDL